VDHQTQAQMEAVMIKTIKMAKKERNQWIKTNHQLMPDHQNMVAVLKMTLNQLNLKTKINTAMMNLSGQQINKMVLNHLSEPSDNDCYLITMLIFYTFHLIIPFLRKDRLNCKFRICLVKNLHKTEIYYFFLSKKIIDKTIY